jgi:hypothetical protein
MDNRIITEIIALETAALNAWLNNNPSPYFLLYSNDFTYFDPFQERRLDGWDKIKELYESMRGKIKIDKFEMINRCTIHRYNGSPYLQSVLILR